MPTPSARAARSFALALLIASGPLAPAVVEAGSRATLARTSGDSDTDAAVKVHFKRALKFTESREYGKACEELQKALALKPDSRLIKDLYGLTVAKYRSRVLTQDIPTTLPPERKKKLVEAKARFKELAEQLQKLDRDGYLKELTDPARNKALVAKLAGKFDDRVIAIEQIVLTADYAVPALMDFILHEKSGERRAYAGYCLSRMRGTAVPAICEALKHPDPIIRQILIDALENIADERSVPFLLWLAQEPQGHALVVASAKRALKKISSDPSLLRRPAAIAFLSLAEHYYYENQRVLLPHLYEHLVWRWDYKARKLAYGSVPRHIYPCRMAVEMARNALFVVPKFEPAVPLLICAYFAQEQLLDSFFASIKGKADTELPEEVVEDKKRAERVAERLKTAPLVAYAAGKKFIYTALQRSLRDGRSDVAVSCIDALSQVADGSALPAPPLPEDEAARRKARKAPTRKRRRPSVIRHIYGTGEPEKPVPPPQRNPYAIPLDGMPLIQALAYPHKNVRYAAAEAVVDMAPTHVIRDADKVISNLSEALSETAVRVALLVDQEGTTVSTLRGLLRGAGVFPMLARTQRDALALARALPPKDIIILNGQSKAVPAEKVLAALRQVESLKAAPAIVVTQATDLPRLKKLLEGENVGFITLPASAEAVTAEIEKAFDTLAKRDKEDKERSELRRKAAAVRISGRAAETLAKIDPRTSLLKVRDALPALRRAAASPVRADSVRIPACRALGRIADPSALPILVSVYKHQKSTKPLRLAALRALGTCAARVRELPRDVAAVLKDASQQSDVAYRREAARAYGRLGGAGDALIDAVERLHGTRP